jgi:hypothetical protein
MTVQPNEITEILERPLSQELLARDFTRLAYVAQDGTPRNIPLAELDVVDGIPDEYLEMNGSYEMTPEQRVEWEAGVRDLYDGMVRIVVTPTWAKLIDFETTLPSAVEELLQQKAERQHSS